MIYTPLTLKAMKLAYEAHSGQCDKAGVPYIFHPLHVAERMTDEVTVCAALLHDVAEDTSVTVEDLERQFPREVTDIVRLMTHEPGVPYIDYVKRIARNKQAATVKLADLEHNMDTSRLISAGLPVDENRLEKYARAAELLKDCLE